MTTQPRTLVRLDDATMRVLAAIRDAGGRPMLVGGCVRDAILGRASKDIDVEVYGIPHLDVLTGALAAAGRVAEAGKAFGVLKVARDYLASAEQHFNEDVSALPAEPDPGPAEAWLLRVRAAMWGA